MNNDVKYSFERSAINAYNALRSKYRRMWVLGVISRAQYTRRVERLFAVLDVRERAIAREFAEPRIKHVMPKGLPSGTHNVTVTDFQTRNGVLTIKYELTK